MVIAALKTKRPDLDLHIVEMTSAGDRDRRTALWDLKDTGFFTSRLEDALLAGEADLAVHSFKDLPTDQREGLAVTAVYDRRWPEDCLLAKQPVGSLGELPASARVGTSSLRRAAQLRHLRPDLQLVPLRGNVQTRIHKLEGVPNAKEGVGGPDTTDFNAIILARAGLERLGLAHLIAFTFDPRQFLPAPAQGALALQTRSDDEQTVDIVRSLDDPQARAVSVAERQVLVTMRCGCHAPVGAYAQCDDARMELHAFIADVEGRHMIHQQAQGPVSRAVELGAEVARELLSAGGREILQELERGQAKREPGT
jgi:hydroxymethylbilane synthase